MAHGMKVAVVGAGTAGPASALFLARLGHKVKLFERVKHPAAVGAGLLVFAIMTAVCLFITDSAAGIASDAQARFIA